MLPIELNLELIIFPETSLFGRLPTLVNMLKDIAFIAQPDKENYDVIRKNLSFFKWMIAEKS